MGINTYLILGLRSVPLICFSCLCIGAHSQQSLLQAWTKSQKAHSITELSPGQTTNIQDGNLVHSAHDLKFYMPSFDNTCENTAHSYTQIDPGNGTLEALTGWLWLVEERSFDPYFQNRLACSNSLVDSAEEADLCFPTCTAMTSTASTEWMMDACFEVPVKKRDSWSYCQSICVQPEAAWADRNCTVETPYLHGIMWPDPHESNAGAVAPWDLNLPKTTMLAFVGGNYRGGGFAGRDAIIHAMQDEAALVNATAPEAVFTAHSIDEDNNWYEWGRNGNFYLDTWELYASATFCWHPHGDTPTRRALYDSLMCACLPVVDHRAVVHYRQLFNGILWKDVPLEEVFVIIPEGEEADGHAIVKMLASMPPDEIDQRRGKLSQIASALQWGKHTPEGGDAFLMALRSLRSGPLLDVELRLPVRTA